MLASGTFIFVLSDTRNMGHKKERKHVSESFVMGVIALVFLILGYQTALFVHRAAVLKITSNRDHPDTVYISETLHVDSDRKIVESVKVMKKKKATHSAVASSVRENARSQDIRPFAFDPNTATIEDFCRLGFTNAQARSIDNYRKKGGRFRRKEDFARSFVVSNAAYKRLESFIDIPLLDLNAADSAALDALPGIGGWFASRIIAHRTALKGYSCKEQLMDIWKFDSLKFNAVSDLVTVAEENVVPYPLWTYPADSLRKHPYIRNYETARGIVLYRENTPRGEWCVQGLADAGILSAEAASRLSRCIISPP